MTWSDLLDGCDVLANLDADGEAYPVIKGSIIDELVAAKGYSNAAATKLVDDVVKERKRRA